jgi:hypothetical protein
MSVIPRSGGADFLIRARKLKAHNWLDSISTAPPYSGTSPGPGRTAQVGRTNSADPQAPRMFTYSLPLNVHTNAPSPLLPNRLYPNTLISCDHSAARALYTIDNWLAALDPSSPHYPESHTEC